MDDLEGDLGLVSRPPGDARVDGQPEPCAVPSLDEAAFESDLVAWVAWLEEARAAQADQHAMRRLELVYGAGWTAVAGVSMAIPLMGVGAAVLGVLLFAATLALGFVVTAPDWQAARGGAVDAWASLGRVERARLVRIINLSRVAERPLGARLLLSELDEVLASERFANCLAISELRDIVQAGYAQLVPFGSEASQRQRAYLSAGHVP